MGEIIDNLTPAQIDKLVCDWSMEMQVALTEEQLDGLVDRILEMLGVYQ